MLSLNFDARNLLELPPIPIRLAPPFTQRKENKVINTTNHMKKNVSLILNPALTKKYNSINIAGINTYKVLLRLFFKVVPPLRWYEQQLYFLLVYHTAGIIIPKLLI